MSNDIDADISTEASSATVWAVFGDLMAGLLGAVVLILVAALGMQLDLAHQLQDQVQQRQTLEQALAGPLATGRITLKDGRIGISGSVLFAFNSDELQAEGRALLKTLAPPLMGYLNERREILMVSGFTDDKPMRGGSRKFADNWELSAQRALTVTRALIEEGLPSSMVFAAAFGAEQAVASNDQAAGRALNRRVEMAPLPRLSASRELPHE
jgi:flagellar motor protein MotB